MKKIKYFNKELKGEKLVLTPLEYPCMDNEFEYWLDVIKKSYGQYGEIANEDIPDVKTKEKIQQEINSKLLKDSANLQIELGKQKKINATLLVQVAQLGGSK